MIRSSIARALGGGKSVLALYGGFALLALVFGVRSGHYLMEADVEPGIAKQRAMRFRMEGLDLLKGLPDAELRVRAEAAQPAQAPARNFWSGPAGFISLIRPEVAYLKDGAEVWRVRGPQARLTGDYMEFTRGCVVTPARGPERSFARMRIDLASGRPSGEPSR